MEQKLPAVPLTAPQSSPSPCCQPPWPVDRGSLLGTFASEQAPLKLEGLRGCLGAPAWRPRARWTHRCNVGAGGTLGASPGLQEKTPPSLNIIFSFLLFKSFSYFQSRSFLYVNLGEGDSFPFLSGMLLFLPAGVSSELILDSWAPQFT